MGWTLHGGLSGKLYLSMGGWGKAKVEKRHRVVYLAHWTRHRLTPAGSRVICRVFQFTGVAAG
jgi:hypothetical protein